MRGAEKPSQQVDLADFGRPSTMALPLRKSGGDGGRVRGRELHPDAEVAQRGALQGCHNMSDSMLTSSKISRKKQFTFILCSNQDLQTNCRYAGVLRKALDRVETKDPPSKSDEENCSVRYRIRPSGE